MYYLIFVRAPFFVILQDFGNSSLQMMWSEEPRQCHPGKHLRNEIRMPMDAEGGMGCKCKCQQDRNECILPDLEACMPVCWRQE